MPFWSDLILSEDVSDEPCFTLESLVDWAFGEYGIGLPYQHAAKSKPAASLGWQNVTIKIYAGYRIGYSVGSAAFKRSSFQAIGLMDKRMQEPNHQGGIFIGLSTGVKFPTGKAATAGNKTAISKLRNALMQLTGSADDPFTRFDEADGWKPRFRLIDDRRNADERAKREAPRGRYAPDRTSRIQPAEPKDFGGMDDEAEGDAAAVWLKGNGG